MASIRSGIGENMEYRYLYKAKTTPKEKGEFIINLKKERNAQNDLNRQRLERHTEENGKEKRD